jgi:hypothetical protein
MKNTVFKVFIDDQNKLIFVKQLMRTYTLLRNDNQTTDYPLNQKLLIFFILGTRQKTNLTIFLNFKHVQTGTKQKQKL